MALDFTQYRATLQYKLDNSTDVKELLLVSKSIESVIGNVALDEIQTEVVLANEQRAQAEAAMAAADTFQQQAQLFMEHAALSKDAAQSSESEAATFASNAANSETNAAGSAESALLAQAAAEAAQAAAEAAKASAEFYAAQVAPEHFEEVSALFDFTRQEVDLVRNKALLNMATF